MKPALVILRPQPGAAATQARAEAAGWRTVGAPMFAVSPSRWEPPDAATFDALLMTSANAARYGGDALARYTQLPLYAVGAATADAARKAGFDPVATGDSDAAAMADRLRADGRRAVLHLGGRDRRRFDESGLTITRRAVYAAEPAEPPGLAEALAPGAVVLLHSPRAARHFARWCDAHDARRDSVALVAISNAALAEAGPGWAAAAASSTPSDAAMLAAAANVLGGARTIR